MVKARIFAQNNHLRQPMVDYELQHPHAHRASRIGVLEKSRNASSAHGSRQGAMDTAELSTFVSITTAIVGGDADSIEIWSKFVQNQQIRDVEYDSAAYRSMWSALMSSKIAPAQAGVLLTAINSFSMLPEFDRHASLAGVAQPVLHFLSSMLDSPDSRSATQARETLSWIYQTHPSHRANLRAAIGNKLLSHARSPSTRCHGVYHSLKFLLPIVKGMPAGVSTTHRAVRSLAPALLGLFLNPLMAAETTPVLAAFHKELVQLCAACFLADKSTVAAVLAGLCSAWPTDSQGQSPHETLLVNALQILLGHAEKHGLVDEVDAVLPAVVGVLRRCVLSEFAKLSMSALRLWKDAFVAKAFQRNVIVVSRGLAGSLLRGGKAHWKAEVNELRYAACTTMLSWDKQAFVSAITGQGRSSHMPASPHNLPRPQQSKQAAPAVDNVAAAAAVIAAGGAPPLGVTGVAPWAKSPAASSGPDLSKYMAVAPGAAAAAGSSRSPLSRGGGVGAAVGAMLPPARRGAASDTPQQTEDQVLSQVESLKPQESTGALPGMERLALQVASTATGKAVAAAAENKEHMGKTANHLPGVKFHDLAFGRELGRGAFSVVKYARLIRSGFPSSQFPEYAVKTIDTALIKEMGYEVSVRREIASLQSVAHPNVTRLVAAFRNDGNAYLVTEFAKRGDLHTHLTKTGSMSTESARFVVGEIVAAVADVHSRGFAFGDLKPENIVLTSSGHAKLTDFGALRPLPGAAGQVAVRILNAAEKAFETMRDGHWSAGLASAAQAHHTTRPAMQAAPSSESEAVQDAVKAGLAAGTGANPADGSGSMVHDKRQEATTAYMSPELARGGGVTCASDAWALGCVLYFCLAGKPPVWADSEQEMVQNIVQWSDTSLAEHFPAGFPPAASDLVTQLLTADPSCRLGHDGFASIAAHEFFAPLRDEAAAAPTAGAGSTDALACLNTLYVRTPPDLAVGIAAPPAVEAKWSKRQFSRMYNPLPETFDADTEVVQAKPPSHIPADRLPSAVIPEGADEAGAMFSAVAAGAPPAPGVSAAAPLKPAMDVPTFDTVQEEE